MANLAKQVILRHDGYTVFGVMDKDTGITVTASTRHFADRGGWVILLHTHYPHTEEYAFASEGGGCCDWIVGGQCYVERMNWEWEEDLARKLNAGSPGQATKEITARLKQVFEYALSCL
jgi:hypothetical protein